MDLCDRVRLPDLVRVKLSARLRELLLYAGSFVGVVVLDAAESRLVFAESFACGVASLAASSMATAWEVISSPFWWPNSSGPSFVEAGELSWGNCVGASSFASMSLGLSGGAFWACSPFPSTPSSGLLSSVDMPVALGFKSHTTCRDISCWFVFGLVHWLGAYGSGVMSASVRAVLVVVV